MASVNELAYTKMLLHAQQYPHCAVDGFCLGARRGDGVEITDVVPGFHNGSLGGALETAIGLQMLGCTRARASATSRAARRDCA